jgi:penicillin amidase
MIEFSFQGSRVSIDRDAHGIPHIAAETERGMYFGQGYAQAMDRGRQILLMRILGQGRGSELLDSSEEMLEIDKFFRRMNWQGDAVSQASSLDSTSAGNAQAFCDGINTYFAKKMPFEFKYLIGLKYETWKIEHTIILARIIGYVSLQQSQAEIERLIVQLVQSGLDRKLVEELFGELSVLDEAVLRKVKLKERVVPAAVQWSKMIPKVLASNNWVVGGSRTKSGRPILANDPHLEINRLPNVWQEIVMSCKGRTMMGACMPGIPGVIIGRTPDLAWGATYTFADATDSWMEECRQGSYRRSRLLIDQWIAFKTRREIIKRKKKPDHLEIFYENEHGVLDGDPSEEGYYLCTRWASGSGTGPRSLNAVFAMFQAKSVKEGMDLLGQLEMSFNWVFADAQGNIGYQMSGVIPKRQKGWNGLTPAPGWDSGYDWNGMLEVKDLPRRYNPKEAYIVTANNDLNEWGSTEVINMPMSSYRAERIEKLLKRGDLTAQDMAAIQMDCMSIQAERFMEVLGPLLPADHPSAQILKEWDFEYKSDSKGAFIFEAFYEALLDEVFGSKIGPSAFEHIRRETGILVDFSGNFDRILLSRKSRWFGEKKREDFFAAALQRALSVKPEPYGEKRKLLLKNILLGGKFPRFFGIDRGPIELVGSRATPHQGQIYRSGGRDTSFAPSYRMVAEFGVEGLLTAIIGGPSDVAWSRLYASDVSRWLKGELKHVKEKAQ